MILSLQHQLAKTDLKQVSFFIKGPVGNLEAVINKPVEGVSRNAVAVVCHPHPLYDGSLNNKVTYTIARTLNQLGMSAVRFNFRGVGESQGNYADGMGELEDLLAVLRYVKQLYPQHDLWLAGFSFGAYISLRAASSFPISRLITVAPPVNFFNFSGIKTPDCPWLVIQGTDDELVPFKDVKEWVDELYPAPDFVTLDNVGHFFHRRLNELRATIEDRILSQQFLKLVAN